MFSRLLSRGSPAAEPVLDTDPAMDDLELRVAREKARRGEWVAARDVIEAAGDDQGLRGWRISVLAEAAAEDDAWLQAWLQAGPDDPTAATVVAEALSHRASNARGAAAAVHTSNEQFQGFATISAQAAAASRRAIALAPDDPVPWATVVSSLFVNGQRDEFTRAFTEGTRRDPYNFELHRKAVSFLCEKWYGSHAEMIAAARKVTAAAPPGADVVMLPVMAHIEFTMREFCWDGITRLSLSATRRYFKRPEVLTEFDACVAKWRAAGPSGPGNAMICRHWQALGYTMAGRRPEAKATFDEIGPYLGSSYVWGYYYPSASQGFLECWRWANRGA